MNVPSDDENADGASGESPPPPDEQAAGRHAAETEHWVQIATMDELAEGTALERVAGDQLIAVFHHGGDLFAVEALCAHHGGPLAEGRVVDGCVTCPWHGWTYRLKDGTQVTSGEPLIRAFPVRCREGRVEVALPAASNETAAS